MKVWSGSAWAEKPAKVWSGSAWVTKPTKVWDGSAWVVKPPVTATYFEDLFTRANANLESSLTASNGQTWSWDSAFTAQAGITSNQLWSNIQDATGTAFLTPALGGSDQWLEFTLQTPSTVNRKSAFLVLRASDRNNWCGIRYGASSTGDVGLASYKCVAGTRSIFVYDAVSRTPPALVRVELVGTTWTVKVGGVTAHTGTAPSATTLPGTKAGIVTSTATSPTGLCQPFISRFAAGKIEPPAGPTASLLTSYTPGTDRNDFTGEVGVRLGIGAAGLPITWLGARSNGIGGTRTLKLYEWFSGTVQRTATIDYTGVAAGAYAWTAISPITLAANGYYALLMVVTAYDGNTWKNPGPVSFAPSIVNVYDSYYAGSLQTGGQNSSFIGLDLGW